MITWLSFVLLSLASFRLTHLIVYDKITGFIRAPFFEREERPLSDGTVEEIISYKGTGLRRWIGELLSCHWCTGIWVACLLFIGFHFFTSLFMPILIILAVAAVAAIIEVIISYFI
ncbi:MULTISPECIES: DUF1360 domain-containing protein [Gracilibacillus]|uniref:DUF1360 domain-containing protein n=1 Tax=Gracilibacillus dipsosauri TaxID=178340 RepID=A0A317L2I9_9BACI|nr:DUF1360 domain-containing protein [Gracilibacillus dipsosauri]PWU68009.1 DUF1360 domain-containing protein [Gracilibacillus dipsosauri]